MDLFTYLMNKNGNNVPGDLFSSLLGKGQSGTYQTFTGTSITANNTKKGKMKVNLLGNTSQIGTPTPSSPIPVNVVSGDNEVVVKNKNLYQNPNPIPKAANGNVSTTTTEYIDSNSFKINLKKTSTDNNSMFCQIPLNVNDFKPSTTYTLSKKSTIVGTQFNGAGALRTYINGNYGETTYSDSITFTTPSTLSSFAVLFYGCHSSTQQGEATITISEIQLEENNTQTSFEPFTSTSYPIHLGEHWLGWIGDYQDRFFKNIPNTTDYKSELEDNEWYLEKKITKQLVTSSSGSIEANGFRNDGNFSTAYKPATAYPVLYTKYFTYGDTYNSSVNTSETTPNKLGLNASGQVLCNISGYTTSTQYVDFFNNNDVYLYYPLLTPTYTPITGTLKDELESAWRANSYNGTTNISQVNNDLAFNLDVEIKVGN